MTGATPYKPSEEQRENVRRWAGLGLTQEMIGSLLGVSVDLLLVRFRGDLDLGKAQAAVQITNAFFQKCLEGDVTAMIFYLKTQCRWRDVAVIEHNIKGSEKVRDVVRELYGVTLEHDASPQETRKAIKAIERQQPERVSH